MRRDMLRRLRGDDEGLGLILVIGLSTVMAILVTVMTTVAIRSLNSSNDHVHFEQALAAAEAGIDRELSNIQAAKNQVPSVAYTGTTGCVPAAAPSGTFSSEASEKAWARSALEGCRRRARQPAQRVSSSRSRTPRDRLCTHLGWSPSRTTWMPRTGC